MELSSCPAPTLIVDDVLESWEWIGSGGFGQIHRAKHKKWRMDVAIKLLNCNNSGSSLQREADLMFHGGNPNVLRILGVFKGRPRGEGGPLQFGLVMEYMERGSLADLQHALNKPLPWPLTFRIAHQVALGMNFLHQLSPPLLHLDLKPSNVLLDNSLNAKLTDFGLSKLAKSASKMAQEKDDETAGTTSYMPPEAFTASSSYVPNFSSDVYSYGVLLWSVITGKEPYSSVPSSLVRFRIPEGDRPDLASIDSSQAAGLKELTDLMKRCWDSNPDKRPSFIDCVNVTKDVYEMYKSRVHDAVSCVSEHLDKLTSQFRLLHVTSKSKNDSHPVQTEPPSLSDPGHIPASSIKEPDSFTRPRSPEVLGANPQSAFRTKPTNQRTPMAYQRQYSTPSSVKICMSNVVGVQIGDNNVMNINMPRDSRRQRHRTDPSNVSSYQSSKYQQKQPNMKS